MKIKNKFRKSFIIPLLASSLMMNINAEVYEDHLLTTPGTAEVMELGLEADGYSLGLMAYTWGYPLGLQGNILM